LPDGPFGDSSVRSCSRKFFALLPGRNSFIDSRHPVPLRGRFAIVTNVGRLMRWTQAALLTRTLTLRTVKSCGPDAPALASSRRKATFADDGGKGAVAALPRLPLFQGRRLIAVVVFSGSHIVRLLRCRERGTIMQNICSRKPALLVRQSLSNWLLGIPTQSSADHYSFRTWGVRR
jgi:hypothetical protein